MYRYGRKYKERLKLIIYILKASYIYVQTGRISVKPYENRQTARNSSTRKQQTARRLGPRRMPHAPRPQVRYTAIYDTRYHAERYRRLYVYAGCRALLHTPQIPILWHILSRKNQHIHIALGGNVRIVWVESTNIKRSLYLVHKLVHIQGS